MCKDALLEDMHNAVIRLLQPAGQATVRAAMAAPHRLHLRSSVGVGLWPIQKSPASLPDISTLNEPAFNEPSVEIPGSVQCPSGTWSLLLGCREGNCIGIYSSQGFERSMPSNKCMSMGFCLLMGFSEVRWQEAVLTAAGSSAANVRLQAPSPRL